MTNTRFDPIYLIESPDTQTLLSDDLTGRYYVYADSPEKARVFLSRIWDVTNFDSLTLERPNVYSVLKEAA